MTTQATDRQAADKAPEKDTTAVAVATEAPQGLRKPTQEEINKAIAAGSLQFARDGIGATQAHLVGRDLTESELGSARRIEWIAKLMDNAVRIPGTQYRIGLDPILGLMPGYGDAISAGLSIYVLIEAIRLGTPSEILAKMAGNIALDLAVGMIPGVGDVLDVAIKANHRNAMLVRTEVLGLPAPEDDGDIAIIPTDLEVEEVWEDEDGNIIEDYDPDDYDEVEDADEIIDAELAAPESVEAETEVLEGELVEDDEPAAVAEAVEAAVVDTEAEVEEPSPAEPAEPAPNAAPKATPKKRVVKKTPRARAAAKAKARKRPAKLRIRRREAGPMQKLFGVVLVIGLIGLFLLPWVVVALWFGGYMGQ